MQGITVAIGKQGVEFFIEHYLSALLVKKLHEIKANKSIFLGPEPQQPWGAQLRANSDMWLGNFDDGAAQLLVNIQNGYMENFAPAYKGSEQKANGCFDLSFTANNFDMVYDWYESYWHQWRDPTSFASDYPGELQYKHVDNQPCGKFTVKMAQLDVRLTVQLAFNQQSNAWETTLKEAAAPTAKHADGTTTPSTSWVTYQEDCLSIHISQQADGAIKDIDFVTLIKQVMSDIVASIPGSGHLTKEIIYDFSLGDPPLNEQSALCFPNDNGIKISVHGGASYKGSAFSPKYPLPSLPFPAAPLDTDSHHLTMYVSNYEIDALNWAYFKAGKLNITVKESDLPNPDALKVRTYVRRDKALIHYQVFAMEAHITQNAAPTTSFQLVYELTTKVKQTLQGQLSNQDYNLLGGLNDAYSTKAFLEADCRAAKISEDAIPKIEAAANCGGMVVTHDFRWTLIIMNSDAQQPEIQFDMKRTDILTGLTLGIAKESKKQTLQYCFQHVNFDYTFVHSTVPGFTDRDLADIWPEAGESAYDTALADMGKQGVPIPIMEGLQFDFDKAQVSIQDAYISILAKCDL